MIKREVRIASPTGLQIKNAGKICDTAQQYTSTVMINKKGVEINAKSFLNLIGEKINYDDIVELVCDGPDEEDAIAAVAEIIENGLD